MKYQTRIIVRVLLLSSLLAAEIAVGFDDVNAKRPTTRHRSFKPVVVNEIEQFEFDGDGCFSATVIIRSFRNDPIFIPKAKLKLDLLEGLRFWHSESLDVVTVEREFGTCILPDDILKGGFHEVTPEKPLKIRIEWNKECSILHPTRRNDLRKLHEPGETLAKWPGGRYFVDLLPFIQVFESPPTSYKEARQVGAYVWIPSHGGTWIDVRTSESDAVADSSRDAPVLLLHDYPGRVTLKNLKHPIRTELYVWNDGTLVWIDVGPKMLRTGHAGRVPRLVVGEAVAEFRAQGFFSQPSQFCMAPCSQIRYVGGSDGQIRRMLGWDGFSSAADKNFEQRWHNAQRTILTVEAEKTSHESPDDPTVVRRLDMALNHSQKWLMTNE